MYFVANNCTTEEFVATPVCRQTKALVNEYKYFGRGNVLVLLAEKIEKASALYLTLNI